MPPKTDTPSDGIGGDELTQLINTFFLLMAATATGYLKRWSRRRNQADIDDITGETYVRLVIVTRRAYPEADPHSAIADSLREEPVDGERAAWIRRRMVSTMSAVVKDLLLHRRRTGPGGKRRYVARSTNIDPVSVTGASTPFGRNRSADHEGLRDEVVKILNDPRLTPQQRAVLEHKIAHHPKGRLWSHKHVARRMGIAISTVKGHWKNIRGIFRPSG